MLDGGWVGNYVDQNYVSWLQVSGLCIWLNENDCPRAVLLLFGNGIRDEDERGVVG